MAKSEWDVVSTEDDWDVATVERAEPQPIQIDSPFMAGVGRGMYSLASGGKQRLDEAAASLERMFGGQGLGRALGMPSAQDVLSQTNASIAERRQLDAPLLETTRGKIGSFVGQVAPALLTAPVSGTLAGATAAGAGMGGLQPTVGDESVLGNMGMGAAGGAAGYGIGKGLGAAASKIANSRLAQQAVNAGKDATAKLARSAGFTIPPSQTNPTLTNRLLEGISGKIQTGQQAAKANQQVTQELLAKDIGLTADQLTPANLQGARKVAGVFYDTLRAQKPFEVDDAFRQQTSKILAENQVEGFPSLFNQKIADLVQDFNKRSISADTAIEVVKKLRADGAKNLKAFDDPTKAALGSAQKSLATAVEDLMERNLSQRLPGLVPAFKQARTVIAKTYDIEDAMNPTTGIVNAQSLAKNMHPGATGGIRTVGETAQAFPKAMQDVSTQSVLPISPLDFWAGLGLGGLGTMSGNPALMASALARPAIRAGILSRPYQSMFGSANYAPSALLGAGAKFAPSIGAGVGAQR
jgi:hypothetical protein